MTAGQNTRRMSKISIAPAPLAALLAATLLGGATIGAAITLQLGSTDGGAAAIGAAAQPVEAFDDVQFRAEERAPIVAQPAAAFDDVQFRAEERAPIVAATRRSLR